ncbi:hypothetical protein HanPI659440_Chr03g0124501 [Helianthus annuus]|nr:hypothetical protein HanPI659440_Chr03g0124501 [Helianthus annuus]
MVVVVVGVGKMKWVRSSIDSTCYQPVLFDGWRKTVEVLESHSCPSGGGASIEEDGDGGGGLKRNYDGDMGSFRVLSNVGLVMVVVQGTGRRLGFHHHTSLSLLLFYHTRILTRLHKLLNYPNSLFASFNNAAMQNPMKVFRS